VALCVVAAACADRAAERRAEIAGFLIEWFDQAQAGARGDDLCHGLGLLKHSEFTCADMLTHAAQIDPASRSSPVIQPIDCFAGVCGEFYEVTMTGRDGSGNEVDESVVLKRDGGTLRIYWYRSDTMLAALRAAQPPADDAKDPLQVAYDEVVARYPSLYEYPPCYGVRPSSSNMIGKPTAMDGLNTDEIDGLAATCGESFCLALVGNKIATLCPQ